MISVFSNFYQKICADKWQFLEKKNDKDLKVIVFSTNLTLVTCEW